MTSTKSQTISKYQFSKNQNYAVQWVLVISILKLVLIWNLVLDAWNFPNPPRFDTMLLTSHHSA
jgi:hypothetical protein